MTLAVEHHPETPDKPFHLVWTRKDGARVVTAYKTQAQADAMLPEMTRRCAAADDHGWQNA